MTVRRIPLHLGLLGAAGLTLIISPLDCAAASSDTARTSIQAAYAQINLDFVKDDVSGVMNYIAPDYTETDANGKTVDRKQAQRNYEDQRRQITSMKSRWTLGSLTPIGDGELVDMDLHSVGTGQKKFLFVRVNGNFTDDICVRDLWIDTPQGWRLQHRQVLSDHRRIQPG
jgi:hypothetical protein